MFVHVYVVFLCKLRFYHKQLYYRFDDRIHQCMWKLPLNVCCFKL